MKRFIVACIQWYQRVNAALIALRFPLVGWSGCRQEPTCSEYMMTNIQEEGALRGMRNGLVRVLGCWSVFSE